MSYTQSQYESAAVRVANEVNIHRAQGKRRLHIDRYKVHACQYLGLARMGQKRWQEVLDAGTRAGLWTIDRDSLKKPVFNMSPVQPEAPACEPEATMDEDTSDEPTVLVESPDGEPMFELMVKWRIGSRGWGVHGADVVPFINAKFNWADLQRATALALRQGATIMWHRRVDGGAA